MRILCCPYSPYLPISPRMALASRHGHTRTLQPLSSPPRLLCRSPGPVPSVSGLRCPKPHLSRVSKLTPARNTLHTALARTLRAHRHRRHALPLHTRSSTTPPKHSPAQNGQDPPLGDPGSFWLATALGSSAAVSRSRHDSTPTASFEVRLVDLLSPRPPRTCSSHHGSTPGPLVPVVAACVKDARPSRWLAPLERPRWPQHRPRVAPPADPSLSAVKIDRA